MSHILFDQKKITPSKIVCIGRNYAEHIKEMNSEIPDQMVVFNKPSSAITDNLVAATDEALHFESEICLLYWDGKFVAAAFGFDLTKRETQRKLKTKGLPWERAKAFDGSALFSEFVAIENIDDTLGVELNVDNQRIQHGTVGQMFFKPAQILSELKKFMTLNNGDIVMTGTPHGVGPLTEGANYRGAIFNDNGEIIHAQWKAE